MTIRFTIEADPAFAGFRSGGRPVRASERIDIFPGRMALALHANPDGSRVTEPMQWGFPAFKGTRPVCHVANITSRYWRPWLRAEWRCAIPASSFSEYSSLDHKAHWFGPADGATLWLAALWRPLSGKRTPPLPPAAVDPRLFALVNAPPNRLIAEHHPASMPTILKASEVDSWLTAPKEIAFELKRPLNPAMLRALN